MSAIDYIIIAIVAICFALALYFAIRRRGRCCGGCSGCCENCGKKGCGK